MQPQFHKDEAIEAAKQAEPITTADAKNLLSQGGGFFYLLRLYQEEQLTLHIAIARADFTTEEGVKKVIGLQGQLRGIDRAIDIILEQTEMQDE